jgi:protocatechuate 3,4-dioxygenase beta subunit
MQITRRSVLLSLLATPPAVAFGQPVRLPPTPSCGDPHEPTVPQTAGPYYAPDAPLKRDLRADVVRGKPMTLAGFVLDGDCRPVPGAMVEIWHADEDGRYDNAGFNLRGHQFTDEAGRWGFTTIVTSHYSFRTAHYHFCVQRPGCEPLTTQLYFPDHPRNEGDSLYDPRLVLQVSKSGRETVGRFDFVL